MTSLRLRLRAWLGWGRAPDDLRSSSGDLFRMARVIALISLAIILYGVGLLWIWRRIMASAKEEPAQVEGVTVYWTPYGNPLNERRADTLVQMRADDGSMQVFRIYRRREHRVRTPNRRYHITYLPTTHRVLDVRLVDSQ